MMSGHIDLLSSETLEVRPSSTDLKEKLFTAALKTSKISYELAKSGVDAVGGLPSDFSPHLSLMRFNGDPGFRNKQPRAN